MKENYYDINAKEFIDSTFNCNMQELYEFFEDYFLNTNKLLDVGFGSGRDMLYFKNKGLDVYGIDSSIEMCNNAKKLGLDNVFNLNVLDMNYNEEFDAIWACASLLHIGSNKLNLALKKCSKALKHNGIMYCSFKLGEFEGERNGRYYNDMTKEKLNSYLRYTGLIDITTLITTDVRENNETKWLNVILEKRYDIDETEYIPVCSCEGFLSDDREYKIVIKSNINPTINDFNGLKKITEYGFIKCKELYKNDLLIYQGNITGAIALKNHFDRYNIKYEMEPILNVRRIHLKRYDSLWNAKEGINKALKLK